MLKLSRYTIGRNPDIFFFLRDVFDIRRPLVVSYVICLTSRSRFHAFGDMTSTGYIKCRSTTE